MPPTTQQVLDALEEMQKAPIPIGYQSVAKSAANEIVRLRKALDQRSKLNHHRAKLIEKMRAGGQGGLDP